MPRRPLALIAFACACALSIIGPASADEDDATIARALDAHVQAYENSGRFRGAVLVARDRHVVYQRAVGMAGDARPNDATTLFHVGSISKMFVAASILKLQEQGRLRTSDPLHEFFPEVPASRFASTDGAVATLAHALHHTSGLRRSDDTLLFFRLWQDEVVFREQLDAVTANGLLTVPGASFSYNNFGFVLLAEIVTRVSGVPYARYLREHVLANAPGAEDITTIGAADATRMARGAVHALGGWVDSQRAFGLDARAFDSQPSGNLVATPSALFAWIDALANGRILSSASLDEMITPALSEYGYGIGVNERGGWKRISHAGAITPAGHCAELEYFPEHGAAVIVLANGDDVSVPLSDLTRELRQVLQGSEVAVARRADDAPRAARELGVLLLAMFGRAAWARALQAIALALLLHRLTRARRRGARGVSATAAWLAATLALAVVVGATPAALACVALAAVAMTIVGWRRRVS